MTIPAGISEDTFLSQALGVAAHRLTIDAIEQPGEVRDYLDHTNTFAYAKIPVDNIQQGAILASIGCFLADTNVAFRKAAVITTMPARCRHATPADEDAIATIARTFIYTRFHLDPHVSKDIADDLKEQWTRNFFRGSRGDHMIVAEVDGTIAGFNQILTPKGGDCTIDLIGVHPDYRRQGLASDLCRAAEMLAGDRGMLVGTQVANTPSIRLYEGQGYRLSHASYVYHRHHRTTT